MTRIRKAEGALSREEKKVAKALLAKGWRNQDIQDLINTGRNATINSARITEVKSYTSMTAASDETVDFYIKKKKSYDPRTGLNLYDDERLIRAREAMILAVQVFNNPGLLFKTEVFSVLSNVAWTYLLHEHYVRRKVAIEGEDGRTLLLSQMIERHDLPLSKGIRNNIRDIIEIRNDVEHKLLRRADFKFFQLFQACCLNFDKALCELFNDRLSLKHELSLALQFARLDFEQIQILNKYDIPDYIQTLDSHLEDRLTEEEKSDLEYKLRVIYTLESASKSKSHMQFIHPDSAEGKEIHNVLVKHRISDEDYPYKPKKVSEEVNRISGKDFTSRNHTQAMYLYGARPKNGSKDPSNTNKDWCIYHSAHNDYTYSQTWIDYLVECATHDHELQRIKAHKIR